MAPFYVASGIILNGNHVSSIDMQGNGVSVNNGTVQVPGVVLSEGSTTINSPVKINLAGTATLAQNATPPSIVQSASSNGGSLSFPSNPTAGNTLLYIGMTNDGNNYNYDNPTGWTIETSFANYYAIGISSIISNGTNPVIDIAYQYGILLEIENFYTISANSGNATLSGNSLTTVVNTPTSGAPIGLCVCYCDVNLSSVALDLPSGATLLESIAVNGVSAGLIYAPSLTPTSETFGVTFGSTPSDIYLFASAILQNNPALTTATITT